MKEFVVNEYISLKLENEKTNIYINDILFRQCKFLLLAIPVENLSSFDEIESIDEAAEKLDRTIERYSNATKIPTETEFWGHCSNLQAWYENDYDTRLLHRNIAFPLLKALTQEGDPLAKKVFKEEIAKRFANGKETVTTFLMNEGYLNFLDKNDFKSIGYQFVECGDQIIPVINNSLNLRRKSINDLSNIKGLLEINNLQVLRLDYNDLERLPESICHLKSLRTLNLGNNKLKVLPNSISDLSSLKILTLGNNKLRFLPNSISDLSSLKTLWLNDNTFEHYPESTSNLISLENLSLGGNNLKGLSESIGNLQSLKSLILRDNDLTTIPESIGKLSFLETLELEHNKLTKLPESIGNLKLLKRLNLYRNNLSTLPASIGNLISLKTLDLERNEIMTLPESIGKLISLTWLNLRANNLKTLPESIGNLTSLFHLNLWKNKISIFPKSIKILEKQGITDHIYIKKLELMQWKFKDWLSKNNHIKKEKDFYDIVEKKITEIANKNGYGFFWRFDDLGPEDIFLTYRNRTNENFISARANEEGFGDEEYEDFGL